MIISFEGLDGCGKSTQIELLKEQLTVQGISFCFFREPGGNPLSEAIREMLLNSAFDINPLSELLLFSAARASLVRGQIQSAVESGKWVLLDRFFDSTLAYQGFGRRVMDYQKLKSLQLEVTGNIIPDVTIYLRLPWQTAQQRLGGEKDRMERAGEEFFARVEAGFDFLAKEFSSRYFSIDATLPVEQIHEKIIRHLELN